MIGFRNSGLLLILVALCLVLLATCTSETEVPRPNDEATATPTRDQRVGTASPVLAAETATPSLPEEIRSLVLEGYLSAAPIGTFELYNDLAYVGQGRMLSIVRITDRDQPQRIGYVVLPGAILDVAVARALPTGRVYAYVGLGLGGFCVVDVSDPSHPFVVSVRLKGVHVNAIVVDKTHLYVSASALYVFDLADPAVPVQITAYRPPDAIGNAGKVLGVSDGLVYTLYHTGPSQTGGLRILDLSKPTSPSELGFYHAGAPVRDGAVVNGIAYLLVGQGVPNLVVLNLDDPSHPVAVNPEGTKTWLGQSLDVVDQTLYLAFLNTLDGSAGLQIIDVTDPAQPVAMGRYDGVSAPVVEVVASGRDVFLAAGESLVVVDVSMPDAPKIAGSYDFQRLPDVRRRVAAAGDLIYITAGSEGLWAVDVSDPVNPRVVGRFGTAGPAWGVAVRDGYAYVADGSSSLRVIDVGDPTHLIEVGAFDEPGLFGFFCDVALGAPQASGQVFAYLADALPGEASLRIVDVTDPADPRQVSRLPLGLGVQGDVRAYGVAVVGEIAYLAVGAAGLRVVDVSDPYTPIEVGALSVPGRADNLVVANDRVYLVDGDLRIVDVSDPRSPREVGFYDVPNFSSWPYVAVSGRYAFLTAEGTRVLDVSDPGASIDVARYPLGHGVVVLGDERVYVLGDGLYILRPSAEVSPPPTAMPTPECIEYAAEMSLQATDIQPFVGDVVTVTATLTNQGCGMLGMPRYSLYMDPAGVQPVFAEMPEPVVHFVGIALGHSDAVEFPLRAVRPGQISLTAGASFEFHAGYPGPAYWGGASTSLLRITVRSPDAGGTREGDRECVVVQEGAIRVCLPGGYSASESGEQNRRGSFVSYDLERADGTETPYLAELQFFTEASIERFARDCGSESPCFFGDYPNLERYHGQKEALEAQEPWDEYELIRLNERAFLVRNLPCYGDRCVIREYTTFARQIKLDLWVVMGDISQSEKSDRLFGEVRILEVEEK